MVIRMRTAVAVTNGSALPSWRGGRGAPGAGRLASGPAGFTLVELVAALAVMGIAIGLVVPAIEGGMRTRAVWRATRQFASTLRYLRAEAVVTGEIQELVIDAEKGSYRTSAFERTVDLSSDAAFLSVHGGIPVGRELVRVLFFPNGGTSGVEAVVGASADPLGVRYLVTLDPLIGAVSMGDARA